MRTMQSTHPIHATSLLDFPLEIRQNIYRYILVRQQPVDLHSLNFHPRYQWLQNTAILLVSRQVSEETRNVLYGDNIFQVLLHGGSQNILSRFAPANRERIRHLLLVLRPMGVSYGRPLDLDAHIWPSILPKLIKLCIVAQQPLEPAHYLNDPIFAQQMDDWLSWIQPILEYLNRYVPSRTILEIDDDNRQETSELLRQCLSNGFRKVRTRTGDECFRRGSFTWESGYWHDNYNTIFADIWWEDY